MFRVARRCLRRGSTGEDEQAGPSVQALLFTISFIFHQSLWEKWLRCQKIEYHCARYSVAHKREQGGGGGVGGGGIHLWAAFTVLELMPRARITEANFIWILTYSQCCWDTSMRERGRVASVHTPAFWAALRAPPRRSLQWLRESRKALH